MESVSIRVNVLRKTFRRKFQSTSKLDDESDFGTDSSEQFAKANSSKYDRYDLQTRGHYAIFHY